MRGPVGTSSRRMPLQGVVNQIRDGDIIAAASTVAGLDITHTGFAHLARWATAPHACPAHRAPVEISPLPLAERIQKIQRQWGIMIARVNDDASPGPRTRASP